LSRGYRIRSNTVMVAAPSGAPPAYVLCKYRNNSWEFHGPHTVAAILLGVEELAAPACLYADRRRAADGKEYTFHTVEFAEHFDERHFEAERWHYVPVAFLLMPAYCCEWDSVVVPCDKVAFSEKAARTIVARRNARPKAQQG
jgi:hypothetical protein